MTSSIGETADNSAVDLNGVVPHGGHKAIGEETLDTPTVVSTVSGDDEWEEYIPDPPDGGWGWIIAMASFFNNFLVDGIAYCFGVFLADYAEYFGASVGSVSFASSLLCGFYMVIGPVVAAFVNKWGCRRVGLVGSLIAASAFIISTFSPNIIMFQFIYGILGGFGFGLMYLPAVVGVGFYFEKKRALATGMAVCGTGIGTFSLAPLAKYLLATTDWKNTHYVFAGLLLQGCVFAALMRPLKARRRVNREVKEKLNEAVEDNSETSANGKLLSHKVKENGFGLPHNRRIIAQSNSELAVTEKIVPGQRLHASAFVYTSHTKLGRDSKIYVRTFSRIDVFFSGSVYNIPSTKFVNKGEHSDSCSISSIESYAKQSGRLSCLNVFPKPIADILAEMLDLEVLRNKSMMVLCLANLCGMMGYYVPIIFSADRAVQIGIDEQKAALLLSIMGICNTAGRVLTGLMVVFVPKVSPLAVNNMSITLAGLAVLLTPFCYTYATMALAIATYGLFSATFVSLAPVIICEYIGIHKLTNGFGLICLVRGITAIIGPPLEGWLYDVTADYDATFYMGGACILMCAVFHCLLLLKPFKP